MRFSQAGLVLLGVCAGLTASAKEITFNRDVAPIFYEKCVSCHHANDIAPMSLMTYKEAKPWAAAIRQAVLTKKMPPWKADPHYGKWSNDFSLSQEEIATIAGWAESGKLEGEAKALPKAPVFDTGWKIGKPDVVLSIPEYKLEATGPDEYTYITVPTNFKEDRWVIAAELKPGNRKIVHHAHVFVKENAPKPAGGEAPKLTPAQEYSKWLRIHEGSLEFIRPEAPVINDGCAVDDNGVFPGSKEGDLQSLISSFLPGREPDVYPPGTARLIKAGSSLNFQIHYSRATGKTEFDISSVGLIFAKEPPRQIARRIDLSNHMFRIPAGASNHEVTECHTFTKDIYITSLTPHMHLRGKAMKIDVVDPEGKRDTLLNVPAYDFQWQITYRAARPIFVKKGSRIAITAHFDNSANNPANPNPAIPIRWGAASEVEMMDGWIEYVDAPLKVESSSLGN